MTKNLYLKKGFANNAIFSKIMSQSKDFFWLIQVPNISKRISRNGEATIKASRKTAHDKVFLFWGKKVKHMTIGYHYKTRILVLNSNCWILRIDQSWWNNGVKFNTAQLHIRLKQDETGDKQSKNIK